MTKNIMLCILDLSENNILVSINGNCVMYNIIIIYGISS